LNSLGVIGSLTYVCGIALLIHQVLQNIKSSADSFAVSVRSIIVAFLPGLYLGAVNIGLSGVVFWSFLGIGAASYRYAKSLEGINHYEKS
jgi:Na+-driven multidrug efflux pump